MRRLDRYNFFRSTARANLVGGQCDGQSSLQASISLTLPAILTGGEVNGQSQLTATLSGVTQAELPCPSFEVELLETNPVRQSDPSTMLVAAAAERIDRREVRLVYEQISAADLQAIEDVWNGGAALFRPFDFQVPGEGAARSFVFLDDALEVSRGSATARRVELRLLDVGAVAD